MTYVGFGLTGRGIGHSTFLASLLGAYWRPLVDGQNVVAAARPCSSFRNLIVTATVDSNPINRPNHVGWVVDHSLREALLLRLVDLGRIIVS